MGKLLLVDYPLPARESEIVTGGASQAGGSRGFLTPLAPLAPSCDPLRESLYKNSLGNCDVTSVWTPLTLGPCGP
jgi:hypothetical protein